MLGLLAPVSLLLNLGCRPEPTSSSAEPTAEADGALAVPAPEPEPEPVPEPEVAAPEPEPVAEPEVAETATETSATETETPATETAASKTVASKTASTESERAPLPKPIHKPGNGSCIKKFAVGEKVKGFKLPSLAGDKTISPTNYRHRVVLLNFWAMWCKPCLEELPEFDRLYRKYRRHGMTLVAVTTDEEPELVQEFVDKHKLAAKVALNGENAAGQYNRPQFPFSFVVDGDGRIVAAFEFVNDSCLGDLEQVIRDSLEQLD